MDISYTDLRCKDVVNVVNGSKMGKIVDLIVDSNGKCVLGLVVPGIRKIFKSNEAYCKCTNNIFLCNEACDSCRRKLP